MSAKRRGLGRGLDALLEPPKADPGIRSLPLDRLVPNRFQPRTTFDESGLEELADSIRAQGVVQPIVVTPGSDDRYTIVAGERRWRAARRAGLDEVPVVVRDVAGDQEMVEMALVENLQRTDLNAVEEAEAYRTLQEKFGLTQEQIGVRVGKRRSSITNRLRLLKLEPEIQDSLREGALSAGQALPLLALARPEDRLALARKAVAKGLSAREIERRVSAPAAGKKKTGAVQDPDTRAAEDRLTRRLQTRVQIRRRSKGGELRIHFHSEDELMRLFELLMRSRSKT